MTLRVVVAQPGAPPAERELDASMEAVETLVGGLPYVSGIGDNLCVVYDLKWQEKGKGGAIFLNGDRVGGTFFIAVDDGDQVDGLMIGSLDDDQVKLAMDLIEHPPPIVNFAG